MSGPAHTGGSPDRFAALRQPLYRRFWLASLVSVGGAQLNILGQGWLIYELTGSTLQLGLLGAATSVPNIVLTLFGGVLADRVDRLKLMQVTSLAVAALLATLAFLDASGVVQAWHVLVIAALISAVTGLEWPARAAVLPSLIERSAMMSAVALNSFVWQSTRMVIPALGGLLIAAFDTWLVFAFAAAGALVMFAVLRRLDVRLPPPPGVAPAVFAQIAEGVRYVLTTPLFALLFLVSWTSMLFGTIYQPLMPAFAALLGGDERSFGWLLSATGVGSVLGTLVVSGLQHHARLGQLMLGSAAASMVAVLAFCAIAASAAVLPGALWLALLAALAVALFAGVFFVGSMTVLQLRVPDALRGRVMGLHGITFSLAPLGALAGGAIAELTSTPVAVAAAAALQLAVLAAVATLRDDIRGLDGRQLHGA